MVHLVPVVLVVPVVQEILRFLVLPCLLDDLVRQTYHLIQEFQVHLVVRSFHFVPLVQGVRVVHCIHLCHYLLKGRVDPVVLVHHLVQVHLELLGILVDLSHPVVQMVLEYLMVLLDQDFLDRQIVHSDQVVQILHLFLRVQVDQSLHGLPLIPSFQRLP